MLFLRDIPKTLKSRKVQNKRVKKMFFRQMLTKKGSWLLYKQQTKDTLRKKVGEGSGKGDTCTMIKVPIFQEDVTIQTCHEPVSKVSKHANRKWQLLKGK